MLKLALILVAAAVLFTSVVCAQTPGSTSTVHPSNATAPTVNCQTLEVFVAEWPGASVVIFHQRDKTDGPMLGDLLTKYSGQEVEFETADSKIHRATVERLKSCFGRGLLVFASDEANLGVKEDFVIHFGNHK